MEKQWSSQFSEGDNEFLGESRTKLAINRDPAITALEDKNEKLQQEITKVDKVLRELSESKPAYGIKLPQINPEVLQKELANAYKMIKSYEYEINKRQKVDSEIGMIENIRKLEKNLQERGLLKEKLRKEIADYKKISLELEKSVKDNTARIQFELKSSQLNTEIKYLQEKIRELDAKKQIYNANSEKQKAYIERIEQQFFKLGGQEALVKVKSRLEGVEQAESTPEELEEGDPRTEAFIQAQNEIKLFKKLNKDYESKVELLTKEKEEVASRNLLARNKLVEIEYQIEIVEAELSEAKLKVKPQHLEPRLAKSLIQEEKKRYESEVTFKRPTKIKPLMPHSFPFAESGSVSQGARRFNDRLLLGKQESKIVGFTFIEEEAAPHRLLGIQVKYQVGKYFKICERHLESIRPNRENAIFLQADDYIVSADVVQNVQGLIIGVVFLSKKNVVVRGGDIEGGLRNPLVMEKGGIPSSLFGSVVGNGIELLGIEYYQNMIKE